MPCSNQIYIMWERTSIYHAILSTKRRKHWRPNVFRGRSRRRGQKKLWRECNPTPPPPLPSHPQSQWKNDKSINYSWRVCFTASLGTLVTKSLTSVFMTYDDRLLENKKSNFSEWYRVCLLARKTNKSAANFVIILKAGTVLNSST